MLYNPILPLKDFGPRPQRHRYQHHWMLYQLNPRHPWPPGLYDNGIRAELDDCLIQPTLRFFDSRGRLHNPDGPAVIEYGSDEFDPWVEIYFQHDQCHRPVEQGPAVITYEDNERRFISTSDSAYWVNNKKLRRKVRIC